MNFTMTSRPFHSGKPASRMRRLLACMAISMGCVNLHARTPSATTRQFPHPDRIRYDGDCLTVEEGKDIFVSYAAFHYFRAPRELWRDRFQKIKDAGVNTVETYAPWNWHERDMPASLDDTLVLGLRQTVNSAKVGAAEVSPYPSSPQSRSHLQPKATPQDPDLKAK